MGGKKEVLIMQKKHTILELKDKGFSNRDINKITGISRSVIGKYVNNNKETQEKLSESEDSLEIKLLQEKLTEEPKYNSTNRQKRRFTAEVEMRLTEILAEEVQKTKIFGKHHKQALTKKQIHQKLVSEGYNIGETTIRTEINRLKDKPKECFINQQYEYGDRLEYDFGEFKAIIEDESELPQTFYLAALAAPASDHYWAYVYDNTKKEVFHDSHVRFFHQFGGVWRQITYDNMRNVVSKFIGLNEKELNKDLLKLSIYYGFEINVTNCFSGNEKGTVEGRVKHIRNLIFATLYRFPTRKTMEEYLHRELVKLNENSKISEEREKLIPLKPKYELANITKNKVDKFSYIRVDNDFYSVPEYLVGKDVTTKIYHNEIHVYANNHPVCIHKKRNGTGKKSVDIKHYLKTFISKPGALKNSHALKSIPELKSIYDEYYSMDNQTTQLFIEVIIQNKEKPISEIISIFKERILSPAVIARVVEHEIKLKNEINNKTRKQTTMYNQLSLGRN